MTLRFVRKTFFLSCEGSDEKTFVDYIASIYSRGKSSPRTRDAEGGSPKDIVEHCIRRTQGKAFDLKAVFMDTDITWDAETKELIDKHNIATISSSPCLEANLLLILDHSTQTYTKTNSKSCKKTFQDTYLNKRKSLETKDCEKLFPKKLLELKRKSIPWLEQLISLFEGNF